MPSPPKQRASLSGVLPAALQPTNQKALARFSSEENCARLERVKTLAEKKGMSVAEVVLAYITSHAFPAAALIGSKSVGQLEESMAAADASLSPNELSFLTGGSSL